MITAQEESEIIDRIISGEEQLYAHLVDEYKSYAYTIAFKVTQNKMDAEEVAQESFIKAFQYLKGFKKGARFSTWLYRIVFNTAISYKRKNKKVFETIAIIHESTEETESSLEGNDKKVFIKKALDQLNEADRLSLQLFYLKEFSLEEVAELMGQKINTTKVRIHRARHRLADELTALLKKEALTL